MTQRLSWKFGFATLILVGFVYGRSDTILDKAPPLNSYNVDTGAISVSGMSSGAFMAVQYHISWSSETIGMAALAGGPYWCSMNLPAQATRACMKKPEEIKLDLLWAAVDFALTNASIDSPYNHLPRQKLYFFSGTQDEVVVPGVSFSNAQFYAHYVPQDHILYNAQTAAVHTYPTTDYGAPCTEFGPPYINACGVSISEEYLTWIYGPLKPPVHQIPENLYSFDQTEFISGPRIATGLAKDGWVYVPSACAQGASCGVVIHFHGCRQSSADVGTEYVSNIELNELAESNNLIVLYPQIAREDMKNCWDWLGYTGPNFATQTGAQISSVHRMVNRLRGA